MEEKVDWEEFKAEIPRFAYVVIQLRDWTEAGTIKLQGQEEAIFKAAMELKSHCLELLKKESEGKTITISKRVFHDLIQLRDEVAEIIRAHNKVPWLGFRG